MNHSVYTNCVIKKLQSNDLKKMKEREDDNDNVAIRKIDLSILYAKNHR